MLFICNYSRNFVVYTCVWKTSDLRNCLGSNNRNMFYIIQLSAIHFNTDLPTDPRQAGQTRI